MISDEKQKPGLSVTQEAARAVGRRVGRHIAHNNRPIELGRIMRVQHPMMVEMFVGRTVLHEERDFKMSQFLRWWDENYQLMKLDVLLLTRLHDETWIAFDVRSDRDVEAGIRPSRPPASQTGDMRPAEASADITMDYVQVGLAADVTLPASTLAVGDTKTFLPSGRVLVVRPGFVSEGVVEYTGKTATTLTGCTGGKGTFLVADGALVTQTVLNGNRIINKLEVYDNDGTLVGYVPIYKDLP